MKHLARYSRHLFTILAFHVILIFLIPLSLGHSTDIVEVPASITPVVLDGNIPNSEWSDATIIYLTTNTGKQGWLWLKYEWPSQILAGSFYLQDVSSDETERLRIYFDVDHDGRDGGDINDIVAVFFREYQGFFSSDYGFCRGDDVNCSLSGDPFGPFSSISATIVEYTDGWGGEFKLGIQATVPSTMGIRVHQTDIDNGTTNVAIFPESTQSDMASTWGDLTFPLQGGAITVTTTSTLTVTTTSRTTIITTRVTTTTATSTTTNTVTLEKTLEVTSTTTALTTMTTTSVTTVTSTLAAQTITQTRTAQAQTTTVTSTNQNTVTETVSGENNETSFINSDLALIVAGIMIIASIIVGLIIKRK